MASADVVKALRKAKAAQRELEQLVLTDAPSVPQGPLHERFLEIVTEPRLRAVTEKHFTGGNYRHALLDACIFLDDLVRERSGIDESGARLMERALSPTNPRLRLSDLKTQSKKDQQAGYMRMLAGCMTGVRNPSAHDRTELDPEVALERLGLVNHFVRTVLGSKRTRSRKTK